MKKDYDSTRIYRNTQKKGASQTYDTPSCFFYYSSITLSSPSEDELPPEVEPPLEDEPVPDVEPPPLGVLVLPEPTAELPEVEGAEDF